MIKVVNWNIGRTQRPLNELLDMDADIALLQEVHPGGWKWLSTVKDGVAVSSQEPWAPWEKGYYDRWPLVVKLSNRVEVEWFKQTIPTRWVGRDEIATSGIGTIAAAVVKSPTGKEPFVAVSMYARWFEPHPIVGGGWIYPDASAHRVISDLSAFVGFEYPSTPMILAAGDLNVSFRSSHSFDERAQTILDRMESIGLDYLGPEYPNGRKAHPVPGHLTEESKDVPTYHTSRRSPAEAGVQVDHVFASQRFRDQIRVRALNEVDEWGPSDHCRIWIEIED